MADEELKNYKHKIPWVGGEYEGQLKFGVPEGLGKLVMPNSADYEGEWLRGKPHGRGTLHYPGGGIYRGEVRQGKRQGQGVYTTPDGKIYKGLWDNNKLVKTLD